VAEAFAVLNKVSGGATPKLIVWLVLPITVIL
jgi:hypothetical protein